LGAKTGNVPCSKLAHALGSGYEQYGRENTEVLFDSVTHVVCSSGGLDVSGESIPYE